MLAPFAIRQIPLNGFFDAAVKCFLRRPP